MPDTTKEIRLRVPASLHKKITKSAAKRNRTVHAEAVTLLDEAIQYNEDIQPLFIRRPGKVAFSSPSSDEFGNIVYSVPGTED